jgi:hypothetical protein
MRGTQATVGNAVIGHACRAPGFLAALRATSMRVLTGRDVRPNAVQEVAAVGGWRILG